MLNQKGEAVSIGFLVMLMILGAFVLYGYLKIDTITTIESRLDFTLCMKEFNEMTKSHIKEMAKDNSLLKNIVLGETTAVATTMGAGATAKAASKSLKKLIKARQSFSSFSYVKNVATLSAQGCPIPMTSNITPYNPKNVGYFEQRQLRKNRWKVLLRQKGNIGLIHYSLVDQLDTKPEVVTSL